MIHDQNTPTKLNNLHNNVEFSPKKFLRIDNGNSPSPTARRKEGQDSLHAVLLRADQANVGRVRAQGARWSLSEVAQCKDGWLLQTEGLTFTQVGFSALHADSPYQPQDMCWVQSGTLVAQLNYNLGINGRSLSTTGASNGQTIAGATSTGTHGAAFGVGAIHDSIVAMHIVCSPTRSVWLEAKSAPVIPDAMIRQQCGPTVEIIRDDDVLLSAQVAFGSFGLVESFVLKTEPLFLLSVYRETMEWNSALKTKIQNFDFKEEPNLYHLEVTFDPLDVGLGRKLNPWVTTMYKSPAPPGYSYRNPDNPKNVMITDPAAVHWGSSPLGQVVKRKLLRQASEVLARRYKPLDPKQDPALKPIPLGVVFRDVVMRNLGASTEIGVPLNRTEEAVATVTRVIRQAYKDKNQPFMGPVALRFVKASRATLAFSRFAPVTCCIELPGGRLRWVPELYQNVFAALAAANIPFALHWGQEGPFDRQSLMRAYGAQRLQTWKDARRRVLNTADLRQRFANDLLTAAQLAD